MDQQTSEFVAAALACVGARFKLQGRDPAYGLDCVGLLAWCASRVGLPVADRLDYGLHSDPAQLAAHLQASGFVDITGAAGADEAIAPGRVLVFALSGSPNHAAISTPQGIVHADMRLRRVVHHQLAASWRAAVRGVYAIAQGTK